MRKLVLVTVVVFSGLLLTSCFTNQNKKGDDVMVNDSIAIIKVDSLKMLNDTLMVDTLSIKCLSESDSLK